MFANFIYFIVALLIFATYQPAEQTNFAPVDTVFLFLGLILIFFLYSRRQFLKIRHMVDENPVHLLDQQFSSALTRQSVLAIALFAVDIYGLNLPSFWTKAGVFTTLPTLEALLFLALFTGYLALVWFNSHDAYQAIYRSDHSRKAYIVSNISLSLPVLLPWLMLSGIADLILALPFELPRRILQSPEGEIAYFLVFLFIATLVGPLIVQKFWRCRPVENGFFRQRIEALCKRAGLKYADILYWPIFGGQMITAGVMGLVKKFRYILVTDALLRLLTPEEIDAVIAHEIGHIKKRHLFFYLFFMIEFTIIAFCTYNLTLYGIVFSEAITRLVFSTGIALGSFVTGMHSLTLILCFLIYFRFVFGYFMRNFERQADAFVYTLFDSAGPLISTFRKIAAFSGHSADKPNWHHFSIKERVDFLISCEADRQWITRHDRKVLISIIVYLVAMVCLGGVGYQLNFGQTGRQLNEKVFEKVILHEIEHKGEQRASLFGMLGDLYFGREEFDQAVAAYQKALDLAPDSPIVLNNFAWLLSTCRDTAYRNPEMALSLARKAVSRDRSPHALDTLAESLFVNGQRSQAIQASQEALELATTNRAYYKGQLKKFQAAQVGN